MPINFDQETNRWFLETENMGYVFGLDDQGKMKNLYWGAKLPRFQDYPEVKDLIVMDRYTWNDEFSVRGEKNNVEHCLKVEYYDGVRDVVLNYKSFEVNGNDLVIRLSDDHYSLNVNLFYKLIEEYDIIERWIEIENNSNQEINVEDMKSASLYVENDEKAKLNYLAGMWGSEFHLRKEDINEGSKVLESRVGKTSAYLNPFFAIDYSADEDHGKVYFGELAWSGNWKIVVQKRIYERIAIIGGINDWDFSYILEPSEKINTPKFVFGFSDEGFTKASQNIHHYQLDYVLPKDKAHKLRKVIYNSWEATTFNVNEENQKILAEKAAKIGVELFVIDDGWFGERNDDHAGLGDWYVNKEKFPKGLQPLISYVKSLGMDFGIWVEPEMVNPDSELYREHPDWVISFPNRPKSLQRNQLMLNLAREDVKEFIIDFMDNLLTQNDIDFVKWDMNRHVFESGWMQVKPRKQREIWVKYVWNLYDIWKYLREKHPHVTFENCSSGGGRVDIGLMQYADQVWTSDNTDPFDRLEIQEGFSYAYAPKVMMGWVTDWGGKDTYPLTYRFHSSMMGSLGIGADLNKFSEQDFDLARYQVQLYKEIREIVQEGYQFRLSSVKNDRYFALEYLNKSKDEGVLIYLRNPRRFGLFDRVNVKLKGLENDAVYTVYEGLQGEEKEIVKLSGLALKERGILVEDSSKDFFESGKVTHFYSRILRFRRSN
ncbi:MAG: Glycoside hydrolase clan GH-D [Petrotoga mobilis]|nr:MAG: Glycoside hydrolase clan GH-D [Petrotoga mobilis]